MAGNYLRFWGVRGSYPAPFSTHMRVGGNTPSIELRVDGQILILDAGTGVIPLGSELMAQREIHELKILLSHYHWDHISGLPFFVPAFVPAELEMRIAEQMKAPYFPVETETWLADISYHTPHPGPTQIGPARVSSFILHHPGITYGYRIELGDKVIVYAPDNELSFINQSIESRKAEFDEAERRLLDEMKEEDRWRTIEFMDGVDILIHDAQYTLDDYSRKRGWGHSCYIDTVNSAIDAGVKHLFLFSHDPSYDDDKLEELHQHTLDIIQERQARLTCHLAREGMVIDLDE